MRIMQFLQLVYLSRLMYAQYIGGNMAMVKKMTWTTVDFANEIEVQAMREQEAAHASMRVAEAVKKLRELGIVDKAGRRIRKDLPSERACQVFCVNGSPVDLFFASRWSRPSQSKPSRSARK